MEYNEKTGKWESKYWHPALTTDAVVFGFDKEDGSLQVLLIKRGKAKPGEVPAFEGYWALPGGFKARMGKKISLSRMPPIISKA